MVEVCPSPESSPPPPESRSGARAATEAVAGSRLGTWGQAAHAGRKAPRGTSSGADSAGKRKCGPAARFRTGACAKAAPDRRYSPVQNLKSRPSARLVRLRRSRALRRILAHAHETVPPCPFCCHQQAIWRASRTDPAVSGTGSATIADQNTLRPVRASRGPGSPARTRVFSAAAGRGRGSSLGGRIRPQPAQRHPIAKMGAPLHRAPARGGLPGSRHGCNVF